MRPSLRAIAVIAAAAAPHAAAAAELTLARGDAPIRTVTVYAREALVEREAAFDAPAAGPLRVTIARLPAQLRDDSLRVRAEEGLLLLGSRVAAHPVAASSQPALENLRADLRKVEAERAEVYDRLWVAEQTIAHVKAIEGARASEAAGAPRASADDLEALVLWAERTLARACEAKRQATEKLRDLDEAIAILRSKAGELEHAAGIEKDVEIELEARAAGHFRLRVEYVTDGASWAPRYDFRADKEAKAIEVTYLGDVRQSTGEDWSAVTLALSTARPELGARPPELAMWTLGVRPPYARTVDAPAPGTTPSRAPMGEFSKKGGADAEEDKRFNESPPEVAVAEARGATVAFNIPTPETIPSDGKPKRTTIGRQTFAATNRYFAAPKVAPFAYLRSSVTNAFPYPMLAGEANVFFGPDFVGRARVDLVPAGEKLDVYLGVDERVAIERKTEKRFRDTKGVFTTDVRERYEFKITAKNTRDVAIELTIVDQLPVSQHEDVRVEDVAFAPEPTEKKDATGERRWNLALAAHAEQAVKLAFTIRFPEKEESALTGLER
jgi:uncharacterized protein (TIGR02231 family)